VGAEYETAKAQYTIGDDGWVCVVGPGASYYTSKCTNCGVYTYQLWEVIERPTSLARTELLCKACYQKTTR